MFFLTIPLWRLSVLNDTCEEASQVQPVILLHQGADYISCEKVPSEVSILYEDFWLGFRLDIERAFLIIEKRIIPPFVKHQIYMDSFTLLRGLDYS